MFHKSKRILWLLNHKTLMPYEVPLMQRLGFEVYVPKIFPNTGVRNSVIDSTYDGSMTLPALVLEALNAFNFYEDPWTPEIVMLLNRYFGCAFIIPQSRMVEEAVDKFEGQLVLRAFGLDNNSTYKRFLEVLYGPLILRKIAGIQHRFWFGEGYEHLHEVEPPLFKQRRLFLPIGIPDSFFTSAGQWTGQDRKILFVCPNAVTDPYYSRIYQQFKRDFGDLPHVIVGAQDVPIDDPHFAGFVTDAELKRLYLECSVLYYHSTEIRHVHYSPIEAAINGMPVVFHAGSLLSRLSRGADKGQAATIAEARDLIERILGGDGQLIAEIRENQREISYYFSDAYCCPMWKKQMQERGFMKAMEPKSPIVVLAMELARTLLKPYAYGRLHVNPHRRVVTPTTASLTAEEARLQYGSSLYDGIPFNTPDLPPVIDLVDGVGASEGWGRWSNGDRITIVLKHKLEGKFRFKLHAVGYKDNAGLPVLVRIGTEVKTARLVEDIEEARPQWLYFDLAGPANVIEIDVPHPVRPEGDTRDLGIGMIAIGVAPPVSLSLEEARARLGSSLEDGWTLSNTELPVFVESLDGVCANEAWGRWSNGDRITVVLNHQLEGKFRFKLHAIGYKNNAGAPVSVRIGPEVQTARLVEAVDEARPQWLDFDLAGPANVIEIDVPHPMRSDGDTRTLGIGMIAIGVAPPVGLSLEDARARLGASLEDGWTFSNPGLPVFVDSANGVGASEAWGRWSNGNTITLVLQHKLEGRFRLSLRAVGYKLNAGAPVPVRIGREVRTVRLVSEVGQAESIPLSFDLLEPSNIVEIGVPHPTRPPMDTRDIGVGLIAVKVGPPISLDLQAARKHLGSTLEDGWTFSDPELPCFIDWVQGIYKSEPWGRWSDGNKVAIELKHLLKGRFRLHLSAVGLGPNANEPSKLRVGNQECWITLPPQRSAHPLLIEFNLLRASNLIELEVPFPITAPGDIRKLGIGFYEMHIEVL